MGCRKRVQPKIGKVRIGPALMIGASPTPAASVTFAQDATQSHPYPTVQIRERGLQTVLEIPKPASQDTVDVRDNTGQAMAVGAVRLRSHGVPQLIQTLLPRPVVDATLGPREVIAQEVESSGFALVHDARFLGV